MSVQFVDRDGVRIACQVDGPDSADAPTVIFANSLGSSMALWAPVLPLLPTGLRMIRYDLRGHGDSDVPAPPYTMGALVSDAAAVCDHFAVKDALMVGLSVGGMIAQGLAVKRPAQVRALVLACTAAKIGNPKLWQDRIDAVRAKGLTGMAETILDRWFGKDFRHTPDAKRWRDMLTATDIDGYAGVCHAIAGTDFYTPTSGLRIPTLGIAGSEDGSTPPDLVRETVDLIPGSQFALMRRAGHLPCVEQPEVFAGHLRDFMSATGHMAA